MQLRAVLVQLVQWQQGRSTGRCLSCMASAQPAHGGRALVQPTGTGVLQADLHFAGQETAGTAVLTAAGLDSSVTRHGRFLAHARKGHCLEHARKCPVEVKLRPQAAGVACGPTAATVLIAALCQAEPACWLVLCWDVCRQAGSADRG